ncbi:hypothetical protein PHYBOEH_009206 [Phytophthora boehmeriae]|uniref:Uncharacterized protein n=1 Tax=Phytophthora boehmeriae TaxID=109152 RepID=A0A8T1X6V4_9STRA|nr:hypothetical protein PHYBOEH_009206 [Phytophthora boehmeriae]
MTSHSAVHHITNSNARPLSTSRSQRRAPAPKKSSGKSPTIKRKELTPATLSRTYYRRKEEKKALERQVYGMNMQLQHLKRRKDHSKRRESVEASKKKNSELRELIRGQRVIFANTQSIISEFLRGPDHSNYEPVIRLGVDQRERHNTLLAMKQQRLDEAIGFLTERSRYMAMDTEFTDLQRFQAENGDVCLVRFDIKPLRKAQSVKQAFEGVLKFSYNLEISISDLIGDITVRENDDLDWDSSVAQHRLVTSITQDVQVDTNNATFTQYWGDGSGPRVERTVGDELGLSVCNYVDEDALYPYRESERVRQDITFFVMIAKYSCHRSKLPAATHPTFGNGSPSSTISDCTSSVSGKSENDREDVVVATRWTCLRLRNPPFPLDEDIASHIRDGMEQVGQAMFTAIRHSVSGPPITRSAL